MGAYPGDAPPVEEAGNSNGVIHIAKKYGFDYRDSRDDGDGNGNGEGEGGSGRVRLVPKKRRKIVKRRRIVRPRESCGTEKTENSNDERAPKRTNSESFNKNLAIAREVRQSRQRK